VVIDNYLDEEPPNISNIVFSKSTSTFFADISDFSNLSYVYLNLTAHNLTSGAIEIPLQNFTMEYSSGITYFNATALDSLTGTLVNITYNIIAEDSVGYSSVSQIRHFDLDDPDAPTVWGYNATDYGNGSIAFFTNASDSSGIQAPVILQVNSEYYEMYQNSHGLWIYKGLFDYDVQLDYTIFSIYDRVGNENGSTINPLLFPFKSITPVDLTPPRISALSDTFSTHEEGYVEFDLNIDDWNAYQSGVNASSVKIILEINNENNTINMTQIGEITFSFDFLFNYNDSVNYWIEATDYANNTVFSSKRGPYIIDDNVIPDISFWAFEYGNGTLDFYANVLDWPNNDTTAFIIFTNDYFATEWMNFSMISLSETLYWYRYINFPYQEQDVWYYSTAFDSVSNTLENPLDSAKSLSLTDSIAPDITLTLINSTTNDGEVVFFVYAIDPYGEQIFVNNSFYINISSSSGFFSGMMTYDSSFYPFTTYNYSCSYPYQEQLNITVWVNDSFGNQGIEYRSIVINDEAPPDIVDYGVLEFQNGTIIIWANVVDGINGSGLLDDNSSVILNWAFIHEITVEMEWNGSDNFYWYRIDNREPRDAITYNITAFDKTYNIASTGLRLYKITDTTIPIFVVPPNYNETQINHINSEVIFWTIAHDPFGDISEVVLELSILVDSIWVNSTELMVFSDAIYQYEMIFLLNTTIQFRVIVIDEWFNNITSNYTLVQLSDFNPAQFEENKYGIEFLSSESGKMEIWVSVIDLFAEQQTNVTLTVFCETTSSLIINNVLMTKNENNYSYIFSADYLDNFSCTLTLTDLGVLYGYYPAEILLINDLQMNDSWSPEIHNVGYESLNSTKKLFWANITDWGSGIVNATLYYSFEEGKGSQFGEGYNSISMINNGSHFITYILLNSSGTLFWNIVSFDENAYSLYEGPSTGTTFIIGSESLISELPLELIVTAIFGTIVIFSSVSVLTRKQRKSKQKARQEKRMYEDKLSFLSNVYTILVASSAGVPIWTTANVLYQTDNSLSITLSGLSVGIDSFLESFQTDFMTQFYSSQQNHVSQQVPGIKVSVIEQNEVQILILGSTTFRIFVFMKEIPSEIFRHSFIDIIKDLEQKMSIDELGVIDESFLGPQIHKIVKTHLPVDLLRPVKIDLQKIKHFDQLIAKSESKSLITKDALDALKILVATISSGQTSSKLALLKHCDEYIISSTQRFTSPFIYHDAKNLISQVIDFPVKLQYETFWLGMDERVKILISENGR
jgi:hypothetical protein